MLKVLDLFSGIGGFSLGLERTGGFETVAFCEIDPFCRQVLAKHWPRVPQYEDIHDITADGLVRDGIAFDIIVGGFPCQDVSIAGPGNGLAGARSGLWREYARIIKETRPRLAVVENVAALLGRGGDEIAAFLVSEGFNIWPFVVGSGHAGARHMRKRAFLVAYSGSERLPAPERTGWRFQGKPPAKIGEAIAELSGWSSEPNMGRVAHGVPGRVDRIKSLGNAISPQISEAIGYAILNALDDGIQS
jgi:DNA (cytosine-5)-methyltransferase 1